MALMGWEQGVQWHCSRGDEERTPGQTQAATQRSGAQSITHPPVGGPVALLKVQPCLNSMHGFCTYSGAPQAAQVPILACVMGWQPQCSDWEGPSRGMHMWLTS